MKLMIELLPGFIFMFCGALAVGWMVYNLRQPYNDIDYKDDNET